MSGNIFGSLVDSVKEVFSNPQVLAQGVKDGNIARTGNTEYFIDGKDSFHNMKDAEAASGRWQKRAQDELIGLATIGIGKTAQGLYKGAQTANTVNKGIYLGGKTQPLLGMSKSLPATVNTGTQLATRSTTALAQTANTVNKGNNWTKGLTGTLALGTAVGQGISEPSQKKATPVASRQRPKYAIGKYNQRSYNRLSQLQKVYGGDLIRQKDGSYFLRNKNGSFYGNGRALNAKTGKMQNYDLYGTGRFLNSNSKQSNSSNIVSTVLDSNYLYGYRGKPKTRMNNSKSFKTAWTNARNSGLGTFTWNGKSYNTMKKGETQQDYNSWLSKRSKAPQEASPTQGTPGYGIHVGSGNVTLSTPNGSTTDITNSHNVSTLISNGNYKAPNLGNAATNYLENRPLDSYSELTKHNFDRGDIRQGMRANGINPYDYSGSDRKQLRTYLNNPTTDNYTQSVSKIIGDGKIQQNMLNNAVQNQTSQYQLTKPNLRYNTSQNNQLVNLKFKQGGQMYKYQAGAQMVQPQQTNSQDPIDQIAQIAAGSLQGDKNSKQQLIQVLSNKEIAPKLLQIVNAGVKNQDKRAIIIAQAIKSLQQGNTRKARLGAKLDYIKQSIGECPEGQEVVYFKKGGEICKVCAGKKMQNGGKSDPIKDFKKKKDVTKQTYQRNPYTRGKSAKEIAEMQRRNRQEAGAGKGENDANVAPWNYKKKR